MWSLKFVKGFLISTINRQFLFTCYLIFKKMVNYIYKFINSSHFFKAGIIIELKSFFTRTIWSQVCLGTQSVWLRVDCNLQVRWSYTPKELYDALWLDLEFILYFCASGCNFVYETSEIRHSFNPVMSKETMTQVNISGR